MYKHKIVQGSQIPAFAASARLLRRGYLIADREWNPLQNPNHDYVGILEPISSRTFGYIDTRVVGALFFDTVLSSTKPFPQWHLEVFSRAHKDPLFNALEGVASRLHADFNVHENELGFLPGGSVRLPLLEALKRKAQEVYFSYRFETFGKKYKL